MKSPDILVASPGFLAALIIPTAFENANPNHLKTRFILSRAALPNHTQFALVFPKERISSSKYLAGHFDEIIELKKINEIIKFCKNGVYVPRSRIFNPDVKYSILDRYASIMMSYSFIRRKMKDNIYVDESDFFRKTRYRNRTDKSLLFSRGIEDGIVSPRISLGDAKDIQLSGAINSYSLDNGVPFPVEKRAATIFTEEIPKLITDPSKVLRALAFSGWMIAPKGVYEWARELSEFQHERAT